MCSPLFDLPMAFALPRVLARTEHVTHLMSVKQKEEPQEVLVLLVMVFAVFVSYTNYVCLTVSIL